jgi:hypothetical protein
MIEGARDNGDSGILHSKSFQDPEFSFTDREKRGKHQVFDRLIKAVAGASLVIALSAPSGFAQDAAAPAAGAPPAAAPAGPKVKDQGEYDALTAASKETDPVKKLALLQAWQDKYPDSEFKGQRLLAFINTWSQISTKTMQTTPTPDSLSQGKAAAQSMLDNLDAAFSGDVKPPAVSDADWKAARGQVEQQAHMTLGWVALQSKDFPGAEAEFKKYVGLNDQNGQIAYWLGTAIASQHNIARTPEALFQFARAVSVSGPGALSADGKKTASDYLARAYAGYHGDDAKGLQDLKDAAAASAMPKPDFTIKSVVEIEKDKAGGEEQYLAAHPDIKLWRDLKATLTAPDGDDYFNKSMKGALIPKKFNAKIVSWTPETAPTEVKIAIDDQQGDAVIKYEKPLHAKLEAAQAITIEGYATAFTKDPFSITFDAAESHITGIAADKPARAPVRRRK